VVFDLQANHLTTFQSLAYPAAGIGLFAGALGAGKISRRASPIVTYTPGFLLLAGGMYLFFHSRALPDGGAPLYIYPVMLAIGLGGGSILGRVDADVLGMTDENMRGRVFSIKAMAFAGVNLFVTWYLSMAGLSDAQKGEVALWMPRVFLIMLPLAAVFAWFVDIAIWAKRGDTDLPGPIHRAGYALLRFTSRTIFKILFRYEVIGAENIPSQGPVVLCANHASFIDPLLLGCSTHRIVQYIMYSSYYRSFAHPIFRFLRCIPVDERGGTAALKAGMRSLKQGACVGIFPEGHVSDDGKLQPAQGGVLFLAQRSGAPVVAVALKGNFAALPRGAWFPRLKKVTIIYGKPFTVSKDLSREQMAEAADKLMATLAEMLELEPPPKTDVSKEREKGKSEAN
jgi:1-acyl-sn-glycerol-3-phosphate acyltransferase